MEPYSPIKINEKNPPPYSVLNPETNSDSPSEKSKGDRLHSAKHEITQQKNTIKLIKKKETTQSLKKKTTKFKEYNTYTTNKKHIIITTSYDTHWAEERYLPNKLYLVFLLHPLKRRK